MPRKKGGGKRKNKGVQSEEKLIIRDEGQNELYARVTASCGHGRFMVRLVQYAEDDAPVLCATPIMAILPGRMKRRRWKHFVAPNDYVLIQQREFQTEQNKVDILHKYDNSAEKKLIKMRHIPDDDRVTMEEDMTFDVQGDAADGDGGGLGFGPGAATAPAAPVSTEAWEETFDDI